MPIGKSCRVVFMLCHVMSRYRRISHRALLCSKEVFHVCPQEFRGSNMSANSKAPYTADAQSTNQTALQSRTVHELNDIAVTDKLFLNWMTIQLQTVHELANAATISDFMDWMTVQSQTDRSWTEWYYGHKQNVHGLNYDTAVTNRRFMNWMTMRSQTECPWNELWHCSHKQTVYGLNDTTVTDRQFMDWMTLQSQTVRRLNYDTVVTNRFHGLDDTAVTNRLFMDWMTLQSQTEFMDWMMLWSQTDCSWTELWHCSHKQIVHGLNDTAVRNRLFMDWPMSSHIRLHGMSDVSQAHSFNNSQNFRPKFLTAVLLRIQVFCDVRLCGWVSGSWNIKVSQHLHNIRNRALNHTVSHLRTSEPSIHINFLVLLFPESLTVQLFRSNFLFLLSAI
jgi:hypothetical protein